MLNNTLKIGIQWFFLLFVALVFAVVIVKGGIMVGAILIILPPALGFLYWVFKKPEVGIYAVYVAGFFVNGITRYLPGPFGLAIDGLLVITILAYVFDHRKNDQKWFQNLAVILSFLWFLYTVLQLFNPEALSKQAWFFAMRGVSLYQLLFIPLLLLLKDKVKHLKRLIDIFLYISIAATFWAFKQKYIGLDRFEQYWIDTIGYNTHVLMGKLRTFAFYSDAGQFGASAAQAGLLSMVLALTLPEKRVKYWTISLICLYGMLLSGTRGALFVPLSGFMMFLMISKNIKMLSLGGIAFVLIFIGLKYTNIGQSNELIRRMRTALDPNDASLQVRLENQRVLSAYMVNRPFGGGIGSAGGWGKRFTPGTYLADTELDSWYVKIWAEGGIVGLLLFILMVLTILFVGMYNISFIHDKTTQAYLLALCSTYFGVLIASYGNQIFGQSPTCFVMYIAMLYLTLGKQLNPVNESKEIAN
jgi:hypothetical protein